MSSGIPVRGTLGEAAVEGGAPERIIALDGLRGVAVLAVVLFHTSSGPLQGGYVGVDVFFVLSGFLITGILLRQWDTRSRLNLGTFFLRRARRLAPPLLVLVAAVGMSRFVLVQGTASQWRAEMLAGLTYTTNWFQIVTEQDYFHQFEHPSPLQHTWSLAIEEQFYLLLAILLAVLLPRRGARQRLAMVFAGLAIGSAVVMWISAAAGHDVWAYYGTLPRVQALLVGCVLAVLIRRESGAGGRSAGRTLLGMGSLCALLALMWRPFPDMYSGGFLLVALLAACVVWAAGAKGPVASVLAARPLVAIGVISYGVYLWHWPVFLLLQTQEGQTGVFTQIWSILLTLAIATVSYWVVEKPIRTGRFTTLRPKSQWGLYAGGALAVALLALVPARTPPATLSQPSWPPAVDVPSRIGTSGDSTMLELSLKFPGDIYPGTLVAGATKIGCGFMPGPYWRAGSIEDPVACDSWPDELANFTADFDPEVAILGSFVWDSFDRAQGSSLSGPGSPAYDSAYSRSVQEAIRIASDGGRVPTYVLGVPCLAATQDGYLLNDARRRNRMNEQVRAAVEASPPAQYVSLDQLTCDSEGQGISSSRAKTLYRDGVHWSDQGARLVWAELLKRFAEDGVGDPLGSKATP